MLRSHADARPPCPYPIPRPAVDKRMMKHPRFIKGQVKMEIAMASKGFPILDLMTLPWFLGECRGYSLMYEGIENSPFGHGRTGGIAYIILS